MGIASHMFSPQDSDSDVIVELTVQEPATREEVLQHAGTAQEYLAVMTEAAAAASSDSSSSSQSSSSSVATPRAQVGMANAEPAQEDMEPPAKQHRVAEIVQSQPVAEPRLERESRSGLPVWRGNVMTSALIKHKPQSNDLFVVCDKHTGCTRTRTCNPHKTSTHHRQGRPLGELAGWALASPQHPDKASHQRAMVTLRERIEGRAGLKQNAQYRAFAELERPPRDGELSEE